MLNEGEKKTVKLLLLILCNMKGPLPELWDKQPKTPMISSLLPKIDQKKYPQLKMAPTFTRPTNLTTKQKKGREGNKQMEKCVWWGVEAN